MTEIMPEDTADPGWMLDQELADTLEAEQSRNRKNYQQRKARHRPPMPYDLRSELPKPARDYLDHIDGH